MNTHRFADLSFWCVALFIGQLLSGCTFTPQQADVDPEINVIAGNIGHGHTLAFKVEDERTDKSLGRRGTGAMVGAEITSTEDVAAVFHREIADALAQRGFKVVPYSPDEPLRMIVELRELQYSTSMGLWTGGVRVVAAMKVAAFHDSKNFEEFYRGDAEQRVFFVNFANENEAIINAAASELLQRLFDDQKLSAFLTE